VIIISDCRTNSCPRDCRLSASWGRQLRALLKPSGPSQHLSCWGVWGRVPPLYSTIVVMGLRENLYIMPRGASLSNSRCVFSHSVFKWIKINTLEKCTSVSFWIERILNMLTIFRLILNQTMCSLIPIQTENCNSDPNWFTKKLQWISMRV